MNTNRTQRSEKPDVMIEGDMLDQLPGHIKGPQMDDLILATDGFHNLPCCSREIFHK
jgi:hypothetical protein